MAGRIRTIKPEFFEDSATAGLSEAAALTFIAMWTLADDHGNLRASDEWIAAYVFHSRKPSKPIAEIRSELGARLVTFYDVDGQTYAHVRGWAKHQRIDNAGEPRVPLPPGWDVRREAYGDGKRPRIRFITFKTVQSAHVDSGTHDALDPDKFSTAKNLSASTCHGGNRDVYELPPLDLDHRSPITTTSTEAAANAPPATLTGKAGHVLQGLTLSADLFADADVAAAAKRIEAKLGFDPKADSLDRRMVGSECATHARTQAEKFPHSTPAQRLAWAEQKADWILRDVGQGRFKATPQRGSGGAPSHSGDFDAANAAREVEESDRRAAAAHRARGQGGEASASDLFGKVPS